MSSRAAPRASASALLRTSWARAEVALATTQVRSTRRYSFSQRSKAPPQPISMSSPCAPRQRTLSRWRSGVSGSPSMVSAIPDHPRALPFGRQAIEVDLVLEGVHGLPVSAVPIDGELALGDQALER